MKINVTAEDIAKASRGNCFTCPIAKALRREGFSKVAVYEHTVWIGTLQFTLPLDATIFIQRFDSDSPVEPFAFEL